MLQQKGASKFLRFCMINKMQFVAVKINVRSNYGFFK